MIIALLSCMAEAPKSSPTEPSITLLRDGAVVNGEGSFWSRFQPLEWSPETIVDVAGQQIETPQKANCMTVFQVPLGNASRLAAVGAEANTDVVFSPDEKKLAIGTHLGEVLVVDAFDGSVLARKSFSEGMIKWVRWSNDGQTIYAAEQSPDGFLLALDSSDLSRRWTLRLADYVKSSPLPAGEDVYGVYSLPAAYGLEVLNDGALLVAASHSWGPFGTGRQNLSQLFRISDGGDILARWPAEPADVIMKHFRFDESQDTVGVVMSRSADGEQQSTVPDSGIQLLSLPDLQPQAHMAVSPLAPYFNSADIWAAFDLGSSVFMGLVDGRVISFDQLGEQKWAIEPSTPLQAGDVPIHSSIGWGRWLGEQAVFTTSVTYIPFGANVPDMQPPMPHPQANSLIAVDSNGQQLWAWQSAPIVQGLSVRQDQREILVGGGRRQGDDRKDAFGGYLIDPDPSLSHSQRLRAHCATESPVFFRHALASDGRLALIEIPTKSADERIWGQYRLTVMR